MEFLSVILVSDLITPSILYSVTDSGTPLPILSFKNTFIHPCHSSLFYDLQSCISNVWTHNQFLDSKCQVFLLVCTNWPILIIFRDRGEPLWLTVHPDNIHHKIRYMICTKGPLLLSLLLGVHVNLGKDSLQHCSTRYLFLLYLI